ncbi:MAG: hypothetical protein MJB14_03180 [Spirochaetes bacterium]|nr:hypothetical protein [Spirochaetota bacterium]
MDLLFNDYFHQYYQNQCDICYQSELFTDKDVDGSKIIMLFAEIYSHITFEYGLECIVNRFVEYSNTNRFKNWFWKNKYLLGEHLQKDPDSHHIGLWLGKGMFLKIIFSFLHYHRLNFSALSLSKLIDKQKKLLEHLKCQTTYNNVIVYHREGYFLLGEKVCLNPECIHFYRDNII